MFTFTHRVRILLEVTDFPVQLHGHIWQNERNLSLTQLLFIINVAKVMHRYIGCAINPLDFGANL